MNKVKNTFTDEEYDDLIDFSNDYDKITRIENPTVEFINEILKGKTKQK